MHICSSTYKLVCNTSVIPHRLSRCLYTYPCAQMCSYTHKQTSIIRLWLNHPFAESILLRPQPDDPMCPPPDVSTAHFTRCVQDPNRLRPTVSTTRCVQGPMCPRPAVSKARCVHYPLCPRPDVSMHRERSWFWFTSSVQDDSVPTLNLPGADLAYVTRARADLVWGHFERVIWAFPGARM